MRAQGSFHLMAMVHTADWPSRNDVAPWDGRADGEFVYRAIPCSQNAPVNNLSSNLPTYNSLIPGSRSPASTRSQPFRFSVKDGKMNGSIALIVCKLARGPTEDGLADAARDRICVNFQADANRLADREVVFSGSFRIAAGTGRYEKLTGAGSIHGYFMCLNPAEGESAESKAMLRDLQYVLLGTFRDPAFA